MEDKEIIIWTCKNERYNSQRNLVLGLEASNRNRRIIYLQFKDGNGKYRSIYLAFIDFNAKETLQVAPEIAENDLQWVLEEEYKNFDKMDYLKEQLQKLYNEVVEEYEKRHSKLEPALSQER